LHAPKKPRRYAAGPKNQTVMKGECLAGLSAKSWPTIFPPNNRLRSVPDLSTKRFALPPLRPLVCDVLYLIPRACGYKQGMLRHLIQKSAFAALLGMAAT